MFNSFADNSDPNDYSHQEDDELDEEQRDTLHLDEFVHREASKIGQAAFDSCKIPIEFEVENLANRILEQVRGFVRKAWVREALIISAALIFKTGLFMTYRKAHKEGLEIINL
ncbi:MAG: hypothetical protein P4L69_13100 [Desulfosporosinus sp.]|nr:hypothetical protein [Desulfosporosinus sp.]